MGGWDIVDAGRWADHRGNHDGNVNTRRERERFADAMYDMDIDMDGNGRTNGKDVAIARAAYNSDNNKNGRIDKWEMPEFRARLAANGLNPFKAGKYADNYEDANNQGYGCGEGGGCHDEPDYCDYEPPCHDHHEHGGCC